MILSSFESRFCKNALVLKQVKKTVAVLAFFYAIQFILPCSVLINVSRLISPAIKNQVNFVHVCFRTCQPAHYSANEVKKN